MTSPTWLRSVACVVTVGASVPTLAQVESNKAAPAALEQAVFACRTLADEARRLACYDAMPVLSAPMGAITPSVASKPKAQGAPPTATTATAPSQSFGLPAAIAPAQPANRVSARLQGSFGEWSAGTRFVLDNGQVWQVVDGQGAGYALNQPRITIERGLLGSFFATVDGVSASIKVRRLQ
jgi:hypothetical protein